MRPMDILGTFAGKVAAGVLALSTLALAVSSMSSSDVEHKTPNQQIEKSVIRNDSYVVSLNIKNSGFDNRQSYIFESGHRSEYDRKWRFGPTKFSARLVNEDVSEDIGYGHNMYSLDDWAELIELYSNNSKLRSYEPYAKEMHKVLKEAEEIMDDANMIVRVLDGIQTYKFLDKDSWIADDPGHLVSEVPEFRFEGAQGQTYDSNLREGLPNPEQSSLPAWSLESEDDRENVKREIESLRLLAWHYDPDDIKRIRKLIDNIDEYKERLTIDMSAFDADELEDEHLQGIVRDFRDTFYNSFVLGLVEVVRAAQWLTPAELPETFWAKTTEDVHPVYAGLKRDSFGRFKYYDPVNRVDLMDFPFPHVSNALTLPEMPDGGLAALMMPLRGLEKRDNPYLDSQSFEDSGLYWTQYTIQFQHDGTETYTVKAPLGARHEFMRLEEGSEKSYVHSRSLIVTPFDKNGRSAGTLSTENIYNKEYLSDSKETRYNDSFEDNYEIDWIIEREGELCVSAECFPEEEKEYVDYIAPPVIAVDVATYPDVPVPGQPTAIGFRVQNNGDIVASAVSLELKLMDALTGAMAEALTAQGKFCKQGRTPDLYTCQFGDIAPGETADFIFDAIAPDHGQFMWLGSFDSRGDIGGIKDPGGVLGERVRPNILDVVVIDRQVEFEDSVPVTPYPYGPSGDGDFTRNLFVVGQNLPKEKDDVEFKKDAELKYFFEAFEDTKNQDHQDIIDKGWMKYYDLDDAAAARAKAKKEGLTGILVDTRIASKNIMPGKKTLYLNGIAGDWELQFGDISAQIYFVRPIENEPFDLLVNAYTPSRIYLTLQTNVELPVDSIPLDLDLSKSGVKGAKTQKVIVSRKDYLGKKIYISEPLDLHGVGKAPSLGGGVSIPVRIQKNKPAQLAAYVNPAFAAKSFHLATPVTSAAVQIWTSPSSQPTSWLWRDALRRAAKCHDDIDPKDIENIGAAETKELWNLIIWTFDDHLPAQSVKFGQHAATLLLRDMYLKLAEGKDSSEKNKFAQILDSEQALDGYLKLMRAKFTEENIPILRMKVPDIDYGETEYKYVVMNDDEWLAKHHNISVEEVKKRRRRATKAAIEKLLRQSKDAQKRAKEIDDCDVEELILLTGFNFEPIARPLKAEMVTLENTRLPNGSQNIIWSTDTSARTWIDKVAPLAEALRRQQKEASIDTDITLFVVGVASSVAMLSESAVAVVFAYGLDLLDFGLTFYSEVNQYIDSSRELTFSKGAVILLGDERYKAAQEDAKAWYSAAFQISMSAVGAAGGTLEFIGEMPKIRTNLKIARGRRTAEALENAEAINTLNEADTQNFAAFAMSSHMRRETLGEEAITAVERRAIDLVDQYASKRMATKPEDMDLPPNNLMDTFKPKDDIVFEMIDSSGVRKFDVDTPKKTGRPVGFDSQAPSKPNSEPPSGFDPDAPSVPMSRAVKMREAAQSLEEPRFADEFPNAFNERVNDDTVVKVFDDTGGQKDIKLGARVGEPGSTSEAFALLDDPKNFVVRITYLREGSAALHLDSFGDNVLRNIVKSEHVRAVEIREDYHPAPGRFRNEVFEDPAPAVRVTIAERITPAYEMLRIQKDGLVPEFRVRVDGTPRDYATMTSAQMQAYEGAMRDLNAQGYVWLDNKPDNFGFVDLKDGSGRVQIVIIDTGGIVPVRQSVADFRGMTKAELAREIQLVANGNYEKNMPEFMAHVQSMQGRSKWRTEYIKDEYGDAIDREALGLDDVSSLWFNQIGGEMFDYVARLLEVPE